MLIIHITIINVGKNNPTPVIRCNIDNIDVF